MEGQNPGRHLRPGTVEKACKPHRSVKISLGYELPAFSFHEFYLDLSFVTKKDTIWAEAGHEIAKAQFRLPVQQTEPEQLHVKDMPDIAASETGAELILQGADFQYIFNKDLGHFTSIQYNGAEMLADRTRFSAWRRLPAMTLGFPADRGRDSAFPIPPSGSAAVLYGPIPVSL